MNSARTCWTAAILILMHKKASSLCMSSVIQSRLSMLSVERWWMTLFILYTSGQCTASISEFHVHWPNARYLQLRFLLVGNLINLPHTLAFLVFWARVFSSRLSHVGLCTSRNPIPKHYRNILASRKTMQTAAIQVYNFWLQMLLNGFHRDHSPADGLSAGKMNLVIILA